MPPNAPSSDSLADVPGEGLAPAAPTEAGPDAPPGAPAPTTPVVHRIAFRVALTTAATVGAAGAALAVVLDAALPPTGALGVALAAELGLAVVAGEAVVQRGRVRSGFTRRGGRGHAGVQESSASASR